MIFLDSTNSYIPTIRSSFMGSVFGTFRHIGHGTEK